MANNITKPLHVGISVTDMERSLKWYKEVLGFDTVLKDFYAPPLGARLVFISHNSGFEIELFQYDNPKLQSDERRTPTTDLQTTGNKHLAVQTNDMQAFKANFVALGGDIAHEVTMDGESVMFIRDPDGALIEVIEPAK